MGEKWTCCKCDTENEDDITCSNCDHDKCDECETGDCCGECEHCLDMSCPQNPEY